MNAVGDPSQKKVVQQTIPDTFQDIHHYQTVFLTWVSTSALAPPADISTCVNCTLCANLQRRGWADQFWSRRDCKTPVSFPSQREEIWNDREIRCSGTPYISSSYHHLGWENFTIQSAQISPPRWICCGRRLGERECHITGTHCLHEI